MAFCRFKTILVLLLIGLQSQLRGAVVYSTIPSTLEPSYSSYPMYVNHADIFGNYVKLDGTERYLNQITVTMVTWAKEAEHLSYGSTPGGWNHDLTLVVYEVVGTGTTPTLVHLASKTNEDQFIPWKNTPSSYSGQAFNVTFTFDGNVALPEQFVIGITYKTQGYGFYADENDPEITVAGPYNELNVGLITPALLDQPIGSEVLLDDPSTTSTNDLTDFTFAIKDGDGTLYNRLTNTPTGNPMFRVEASANPTSSLGPYETWALSYLGTNGVSPALRSDDPDQDGLNNLTEFSFGLDPTVNSPNPITITRTNIVTNTVTNTIVKLRWLQRNDGSVTYTNRSTTNLTTGFPLGNSPQFTSPQSEDQTFLPRPQYTRIEFSTNTSAFLRHFYKVDAQEAP